MPLAIGRRRLPPDRFWGNLVKKSQFTELKPDLTR